MGFAAGGQPKVQGPVGHVHHVAAHVADLAATEVPEAVPAEAPPLEITGVERVIGSGSEPQVPMETLRHRFGRKVIAARRRAAAPDVDLLHVADRPAPDEFHHATVVLGGVDLRAHLGGKLVLVLQVGVAHDAGLVHRVGQRLLYTKRK